MSDSEIYKIQEGTGRLKRAVYPNGSYVEYTYYGADNPSQVGFVWKVEHKKSDGSLLIGYEYTYDLLGRIEKSVERPSGDTTVYAYTPAGRLESEVRTGQVAYSRFYKYNLDGSRAWVERNDAVNGQHRDEYEYDPVSGRLQAVRDTVPNPPVVHRFAWNPEGTLARWEEAGSYARVFGYDEEGRLVKIERDYGGGDLQLAYEYGYNSDGVRVWKRDVLAGQEYRYLCRIGCGGVPMRVYGISEMGFSSLDPVLDGGDVIVHLHNYPVITIKNVNTLSIMLLQDSQHYFVLVVDSFSIPVGSFPSVDDPFILLPPLDLPYPFLPSFPIPPLPLPVPPKSIPHPFPWLPRPIGVGVGTPIPIPSPVPPGNSFPSNPPLLPNPFPAPPSHQPEPEPVPGGSACERLKTCQKTGQDCTVECMECCDAFCGPGNYPKCYWKCSKSNGYFTPSDPFIHCGPMIVDKPKYPKDETNLEEWIILLCKLLKSWGILNEHVNCNKNLPIL